MEDRDPVVPEAADDRSPLTLVAWLLPIIVAATVYEVVARYVFASPTIWANELSLFLSSIVFITSGLYVMQRDEHLRVSIIYDVVPTRVRKLFDLVHIACVLIFCGSLAYAGFPSAWRALTTWERFGTAWNPPIPAIVKPLVVVVAVGMIVFAIVNFIRTGRRHRTGNVRI